MSGTKYDKDPMKCCCLDWAESPLTGYREEGGHHPGCPAGHAPDCKCTRCLYRRSQVPLPKLIAASKVPRPKTTTALCPKCLEWFPSHLPSAGPPPACPHCGYQAEKWVSSRERRPRVPKA